MAKDTFDIKDTDIAWCPGCGNFGILKVLKQALAELEIRPQKLVIVGTPAAAAISTRFFAGSTLITRTPSSFLNTDNSAPSLPAISTTRSPGCKPGESRTDLAIVRQ